MPKDKCDTDFPSTLERSDKHAQATWQKTHDSALETSGEGERAKRREVEGRSSMNKDERVDATDKANRRAAAARKS